MTQRTNSTRQASLRRAREAKMTRDAQRLRRERQVELALADFFHHSDQATQLVQHAQARAAKILSDAHAAAGEPRTLAAVAIRAMEELGETRASIAELTGLSAAQIRDALASGMVAKRAPGTTAQSAGPGPIGVGGVDGPQRPVTVTTGRVGGHDAADDALHLSTADQP